MESFSSSQMDHPSSSQTATATATDKWELCNDNNFTYKCDKHRRVLIKLASYGETNFFCLLRIIEMGRGGIMRTTKNVARVGIVNTSLRGGVQVNSFSAEHSVLCIVSFRSASSSIVVSSSGVSSVANMTSSANHKGSWEMVDDWEFAGVVEEEVALGGSTFVSDGGEPMARVLFGGVLNLEEGS
ncbi:hypothetical protein REPUB_Repub12eG0054400 [Reevesia pubescens]